MTDWTLLLLAVVATVYVAVCAFFLVRTMRYRRYDHDPWRHSRRRRKRREGRK